MDYATHKARILDAYHRRAAVLFAYTTSGNPAGRAGNSWAAMFWAGFDGMTRGVRVPSRSDRLSWAWYAAGRAAARNPIHGDGLLPRPAPRVAAQVAA
jgi:hypothetical protein